MSAKTIIEKCPHCGAVISSHSDYDLRINGARRCVYAEIAINRILTRITGSLPFMI